MLLGGEVSGKPAVRPVAQPVTTEADTSTKVKAIQRGKLPEMRVKARIRFGGRRD